MTLQVPNAPIRKDLDRVRCIFEMELILNPRTGLHEERAQARIKQLGDQRSEFVVDPHEPYQLVKHGIESEPTWMSAAELWPELWQRFQNNHTDDQVEGMRLMDWAGVTRAQAADLKAKGIRSVEELARVPDAHLKVLGMGGDVLRAKAQAYLDDRDALAPVEQYEREIADLRARLAAIETNGPAVEIEVAPQALEAFEGWEASDLRAYIAEQGGSAHPNCNLDTLKRRAAELASKRKAA